MFWVWFLGMVAVGWSKPIPVNPMQKRGIVCVVQSETSTPSILLHGKRYDLRDDGNTPDVQAQDGFFSAFIPIQGDGETDIAWYEDSTVRWLGVVPLPPAGQQTWVTIEDAKPKPIVNVRLMPLDNMPPKGPQGDGLPWITAWVILGMGVLIGVWLKSIPRLPYRRWIVKESLIIDSSQIWSYSSPMVLNDVLMQLGAQYNLLLCTEPDREQYFAQAAQSVSVYRFDGVVDPQRAQSSFFMFSSQGQGLLVLDGFHGVVPPGVKESQQAVVQEMLDDPKLLVLLLLSDADAWQGVSIARVLDQKEQAQEEHPDSF